jgi:hypothetical protein
MSASLYALIFARQTDRAKDQRKGACACLTTIMSTIAFGLSSTLQAAFFVADRADRAFEEAALALAIVAIL